MSIEIILAILGSGGLVGGFVALFMMRANRDKIIVDAAQGAVVVANGVVGTMREEMLRLRENHETCEKNRLADRELYTRDYGQLRKELAEVREAFKAVEERQNIRRRDDNTVPGEDTP